MVRAHFVGLFLRGIAQQVTGTGTAMVAEPGGRALARKRMPGRNSQGFFLRRRTLGEWRAKSQNLVGFGTVVRFRVG